MQMSSNIFQRGLLFGVGINKLNGLSYALVVRFHTDSIADSECFIDPNLTLFYWQKKIDQTTHGNNSQANKRLCWS